ncbi:DNA-binding transcriptional regulator, AcrR family [Brevibacterium siliguriense]|uniref:DNA-binding transcriptional regulator, AcrR family n=1 Tax=Brevibacterium siliguriense TaxID=1136497 RepID=A0A1H1LKT7_9MICO|nr:TetR/AcrR family transcriptional regulator [Brevibacterium siliguriense]SDR75156.1 DNA-binding transcriptional regulator, AcrR family [Brevibacterium siliguriense]
MPKIVDHAQRRTEMVHALWQVIYLKGIDGVSFRSVAEAAGISVGRVQHYFPSRSELILEGCRQIVDGAEAAGPEDADESTRTGSADAVSALRRFCFAFIPAGETMRIGASVWYTYVARAVMDEQIAGIIRASDRATLDLGIRLYRAAVGMDGTVGEVGDGEAGDDNAAARMWAMRMIALGKGLAQEVMLDERSAASAKEILEAELAPLVAH